MYARLMPLPRQFLHRPDELAQLLACVQGPNIRSSGLLSITSSHIRGGMALTAGSTTTYVLPAPPGHWVPAARCEVWREGCPSNQPNCMLASCSTDTADNVNACNASSGSCLPTTANQPCDWRTSPDLIGKTVYVLPLGTSNLDYPFVCAPGIRGGNGTNPSEQTSATCAGLCPAGFTCGGGEVGVVPVACPEAHYCPEGSSAPTPCDAGTYGGSERLQRAEECTECPAGSWCSAGVLIPCGNGTYNKKPGASNQGACEQCPDNAVSVQGASRVAECQCNAGYYNARSASETPECVLCGAGAVCKVRGVTVATLPLKAGYWRLSPESTEIKRCPDAAHDSDSACVGGDGTSTPAKTRRQLGSSNACRDTTTGPYCQLCDDGSGSRLYYSRSTRACKECTGDLVVPISTAVGIAVVLAGLGALYYAYMPHRRVPWLRMLLLRGTTMVAAFSLRAKAKQCVGFYQV